VFVRVQHIDGSLDPPVAVEGLRPETEIGTSFALPDGRWVQVLAYATQEENGRQLIVGEMPEPRTYSATGHEAYIRDPSEMRMGSPQYGTLMLDAAPLQVGASVEVGSLVWSQDGRYLAAAAVDHAFPYPGTKVVVIDAETRAVLAESGGRPGLSSPLEFVGRSLSYHVRDEGTAFLPF
jgi:hypothetical protein